ncbi:MAG: ABC transporter ATP-binding protein [Bacteriovorax sp.]|jgi:iron complex transport system ATP-binding protein
MKHPILQVDHLSIGFRNILFSDIKAEVFPGTITALMGVNGAGKSCLLKTLGHLIPEKSGQIKLNGQKYSNYSLLEFSKKVSVVLTEKIQVDYLRVDELVSLGRSPYTNWSGELDKADQNVVKQIMQQVGIQALGGQFFSELSDGQKQKVLIARALAQQPQLLILDEPTTYLDIPSKIELIKLLKKISSENNVAVIMSTHDLDLIKNQADQVWLMGSDGSFNAGKPEVIEAAGIFEKHFFSPKLRSEPI